MPLSRPVFEFLSTFWPIARWINPVLRKKPFSWIFSPAFSKEFNHAVLLPVKQDIPRPVNSILPMQLLETLIDEASNRVVMNSCLCRTVESCRDYPVDLGCLFLGDGADQIHHSMAHRVTRDEAILHVRKGMESNLSPTIIHSWFDAAVLGINYKKMLGICFCCPCCCTLQGSANMGPEVFRESIEPIPGISVHITEDCIGCGSCLGSCNFDAIVLHSAAAVISSRCKACGRCIDECPEGAIRMEIETDHLDIEHLRQTIQSRTNIVN